LRLGGSSFDLQYLLGLAPWDTQVTPPEVVELVERAGVPPGRALDLGCGSGTNCIYLARHGWEAVGVDFSAVAIHRARRKARRGRVDCRFYRADVTDLSFLAGPFRPGTGHRLPAQRAAGRVGALRSRVGAARAARRHLHALRLRSSAGPIQPARGGSGGDPPPVRCRLRRGAAGGRG
jgi:SAM-dependent methyltransferase